MNDKDHYSPSIEWLKQVAHSEGSEVVGRVTDDGSVRMFKVSVEEVESDL